MPYSAPAGVYCDVRTGYIHGSLQGHLSMWLAIIDLPPLCRVELLNWFKEWGIRWEEFHQHPIAGRKPLPDGVCDGNSHYPKLLRTTLLVNHLKIIPWFFVMLVFLFCKLFEHHSQTNFPIIKTKPFKVVKYKKGWQIFRPKWVKIKIVVIFLSLL